MSCRCTGEQDSHFTFREEGGGEKGFRSPKEGGGGGGFPLLLSLSPSSCSAPFPSQLDQEALWHFKRHKLACRGRFVGNTRKLETPGRADLDLIGACNYVAKPLCGA